MTTKQSLLVHLENPANAFQIPESSDLALLLTAIKEVEVALKVVATDARQKAINALSCGDVLPGWELAAGRTTYTEHNRLATMKEFADRFGQPAINEELVPRMSLGIPALKEAAQAAGGEPKKEADKQAMEIAAVSFTKKTGNPMLKEVKG